MCPREFSVLINAHDRIDYAWEVLYVILILNYSKLIDVGDTAGFHVLFSAFRCVPS